MENVKIGEQVSETNILLHLKKQRGRSSEQGGENYAVKNFVAGISR
jgi:hypothetical protein